MTRRLVLFAFLIATAFPGAAPAQPAVGGSSATAPVRQTADITRFGARHGGVAGAALQAAIDHLAATYPGQPGIVRIPPGSFSIDRDVYCDSDKIEIVGAGREMTRLGVTSLHSIFFGLPRSPGGVALSNGHRVDLFGKLDTSVCPAIGRKWGLRTWDPATSTWAHPTFWAGPLNGGKVNGAYPNWYPDFWATTRQLTVDMALDATNGFAYGQVTGAVEGSYRAAPFYLWYDDPTRHRFWFAFSTVDSAGAVRVRVVFFPAPDPIPAGMLRLTIQIDLATPGIQVYVNRSQVTPILDLVPGAGGFGPEGAYNIGPNWDAASGLHFYPNQYSPWNLGAISRTSDGDGSTEALSGVPNLDRTFCGLRLTDGLLYRDRGDGLAQQRTDDLPLDDAAQFFRNDPGTICLLLLDDPPSSDRAVTLNAGPAGGPGATTRGLFLSSQHADLLQVVRAGNAIRDLTIDGGTYPWSAPIVTGAPWDFAITDVGALGGYYGVGTLIIGASFPITVRDCTFKGTDSGYFGFTQTLLMENVTFDHPGRTALRMLASGGTIKTVFMSEPNNWCEYGYIFHGDENGGSYTLQNVGFDAEFVPAPKYAAICMESHEKFWPDSIAIRDCGIGNLAGGAATVLLRSRAGMTCKGICLIENVVNQHGGNRAFLLMDDPLGNWRATVRGCPHAHDDVPWVEYARPAAVGHARVILDGFGAEPSVGRWREGTELILSPPPATGPLILKCVAPGDYATATHPTWRGIP